MSSKLVAYAMDFSSFVVQKSKYSREIRTIILFGSVARGEATAESDIDLFIDLPHQTSSIEEDLKKCVALFTTSAKYNHYWRLLGVENEINVMVGDIMKESSLQTSVIANGITLYGKYIQKIGNGLHETLFVWENIKPNTKRVLFNKQLFGYQQHKKFYKGFLQKYGGERLGKGCIAVPLDRATQMHLFFKQKRIAVKMKKFILY